MKQKQYKTFIITLIVGIFLISLSMLSARTPGLTSAPTPGKNPRVKIMSPKPGKMWVGSLKIWLSLRDIDISDVRVVEVYLDGRLLRELSAPPFNFIHEFGSHGQNRRLKVLVRDQKMNVTARSEVKSFTVDIAHSVEVKRIMVPVIVKDKSGSFVRGLKKEDFQVLSDGKPVELSYFETAGTTTFNMVQVIDISYSMKDKIHDVMDAAGNFIKELMVAKDQAAFVFFNHIVFDHTDITGNMDRLAEDLFLRSPVAGNTALYDAIAYTMNLMGKQKGWNIMVVFSDGKDNSSYIDFQSLMQKVKRSAVVIYAIDNGLASRDKTGKIINKIQRICELSGGKTFPLTNIKKTRKVYNRIREDIKASYVLFFTPRHGKSRRFHKLSISVKNKKYEIHTLKGYY